MSAVTGQAAADFPRFSPDQLFALAVDIERYPAFIPWCRHARILSRAPLTSNDGDVLEVDNHFGAGPLDAGFRTHAVAHPPHRLEITADQAPFRHFKLVWHFQARPDGGCRVVAEYDLALRSPILHGLARIAMPEASAKIIRRFKEQAAALYGGGGS